MAIVVGRSKIGWTEAMPLHVRGGADSTDPSSDEEHRYDHVYDNAERGTGRRGSSGRRLLSKQQSESRLPAKGTEPGTDALVPPRPLSPRATRGGTHLPRGRISEKVHEQEGDSVLPLRKSRSVEMLAAPQQPQLPPPDQSQHMQPQEALAA